MNLQRIAYLCGCLIFAFSVSYNCQAAVVNGYASVTSITGRTLSIGSVDESEDSFEVGEQLIIMQMQDQVIGSTADDASFGSLGAIRSAGLYEIRTIASIIETAGLPTSIVLEESLINSYRVSGNSTIQVITFPELGSPDHETTDDITGIQWNGSYGGVVAFQVAGTLTIAHNISATSIGFRGAIRNTGSSVGCSGGSNFRTVSSDDFADKGEGIYKSTNAMYAAGQAPILNGGGGGNSHNAGGGGGGNFSAGGEGGEGFPICSPSGGGFGGIDLSSSINVNRVFMGGGGGSGEGNNNGALPGGNGGGIILIKALHVRTTGSCGSRTIEADGMSVANNMLKSIVFDVPSWNISPTCPLSINASGGKGGDVGDPAYHGGGGGGGIGTIIFSTPQPTENVTIMNMPGRGGLNCTACSSADPGSGTNNAGVITESTGPLPIELIQFEVRPKTAQNAVQVDWTTATETNNDFFTLERSLNAHEWTSIHTHPGAGNSLTSIQYHFLDKKPHLGVSYYRLKQTDFDGQFTYSPIRAIDLQTGIAETLLLYPNPTTGKIRLAGSTAPRSSVQVYTAIGQEVTENVVLSQETDGTIYMDLSRLPPGTYVVKADQAIARVNKRN